jgi:CRP-like cAMP-binding protein
MEIQLQRRDGEDARCGAREGTVPGILLTKLSAGRTWGEYQTDESISSQGEAANAVFYIQNGKVKLTVTLHGEEAVISILPEGSFLGECCLAGRTVRTATASALLSSTIVRIEKQTMKDLLRSDPEFAEQFLVYMLSRSIHMEADLVLHLLNSSEQRPARLPMMKSNFGREWRPIPVTAEMSPESLAETIGTTSSNVSLLLDRFRKLGFIDYKGAEMCVHSSLMSIVPHDNDVTGKIECRKQLGARASHVPGAIDSDGIFEI